MKHKHTTNISKPIMEISKEQTNERTNKQTNKQSSKQQTNERTNQPYTRANKQINHAKPHQSKPIRQQENTNPFDHSRRSSETSSKCKKHTVMAAQTQPRLSTRPSVTRKGEHLLRHPLALSCTAAIIGVLCCCLNPVTHACICLSSPMCRADLGNHHFISSHSKHTWMSCRFCRMLI